MRTWQAGVVSAGLLWLSIGCAGGGSDQVRPAPVPDRSASDQSPSIARPNAPLPTGTLSGRLTDRTTHLPLPGVAVIAQYAHEPNFIESAVTDAEGRYTFTQLPLDRARIRVASQPVVGACIYAPEVSTPATMAAETQAPPMDLSFAATQDAGVVEGQAMGLEAGLDRRWRPGQRLDLGLVHRRECGRGEVERVLVRRVRANDDGTFRFDAIPPGNYEVQFVVWFRVIDHGINLCQAKITVQPGVTRRIAPEDLR